MKATAALLLAGSLLPALAACSPRPPWAGGRMVREERDLHTGAAFHQNLPARLLAVHNRERAALGIEPLSWDPRLAAASADYAQRLLPGGPLQHSPPPTRPNQGENLWMGTHEAYQLEKMANGWAKEKRIFRRGRFPHVSTSGNWADVAHYTQMIWRSSKRVGCALAEGNKWDFLVCRYFPAGNVVGQPVP